jgi:hypothetical protein
MNKIIVIMIIVFIIVLCVVIYRKSTIITHEAYEEYKINVNSSAECSYIIWFNIKTWDDNKKILFKKSSDKDEFIVFIGELRNILYIYSSGNIKNGYPDTPYMISYNNCLSDSKNVFGEKQTDVTSASCKEKCAGSTACVGFTFASDPSPACYISDNTDDIFESSNCLISELKLIEIKTPIPLQRLVKLAITLTSNNMIVYIDDKLINTFLLETTISAGSVTVTPTDFGFNGYTVFKYFTECLNHEKIKKYSIKL